MGPTKLLPLDRFGHQGALGTDQTAKGLAFFFKHHCILQTWVLKIYKSLLALGDGHYNKFNLHLKKKRHKSIPKNITRIQKKDSLVVRFPVTINKSSSLQCLVWSQLRKTSPRIGKHIGKLLDSKLVTLVKSTWVFFQNIWAFQCAQPAGHS